ncbi:MAG: hypothetical protein KDD76_00240, partial [Rickettsiales bacterium]|nr:hypothetical protein [Rickettsiales bacterium]
AHFAAGYVPASESRAEFAQACRSIAEPILDLPQHEISIAQLLAHLFKVTEDFNMQTQPQLLLLQKSLVIVEGLGRSLNPEVNMWQLAEPMIEEWVISRKGPRGMLTEKALRLEHFAETTLQPALEALKHLPSILTSEGLRLAPVPQPASSVIRYWVPVTLFACTITAITYLILAN